MIRVDHRTHTHPVRTPHSVPCRGRVLVGSGARRTNRPCRPMHARKAVVIGRVPVGRRRVFGRRRGPVVVVNRRGDGRDADNKTRNTVGIISIIVIGLVTLTLGSAFKRYQDVKSDMKDIKKFKREHMRELSPNDPRTRELKLIEKKAKKILQSEKKNIILDIALRVGLLAFAGVALAGAILGSQMIMLGGIGTGIVIGAAMIIKAIAGNGNASKVEKLQERITEFLKTRE